MSSEDVPGSPARRASAPSSLRRALPGAAAGGAAAAARRLGLGREARVGFGGSRVAAYKAPPGGVPLGYGP